MNILKKEQDKNKKNLNKQCKTVLNTKNTSFTELGLNGSQILDRAMKETEIYLNFRQRTVAEIRQLER